MLTTEERRLEFVKLVQSMRTAQKDNDFENARCCERQVDRALLRLEWVEKGLFG